MKNLDTQPAQPERPKLDMRGFVDDDDELDSKFMANSRKSPAASGGYKVISPVTQSAREEEIDSNLGWYTFLLYTLLCFVCNKIYFLNFLKTLYERNE